ncbi:UPF0764 protein C16orf89 homolog isoform X2 [Dendropsophus ebraccatus]|uniref:UPF0764 protein C16orf89 homolog isoform X2 n=1 Tax=Dendropsophus ebraccatus TaxID=150705 RepID=UPI003831FE30
MLNRARVSNLPLQLNLIYSALFTPCTTNNMTAVRSVISAIWKAVILLKNEYKEFNLDGIGGFRILLEQIKGTLERFDTKKDPYAYLLLNRLKKVLSEILNKTSHFTKQQDPEYFKEFQQFIGDQFWIPPTSWNQTMPRLVYGELLPLKSPCFEEPFSDECISSLFGSLNKDKEPCVVTTPCRKKMTQKGCSDYVLSHQLLFFMIGKMNHCRDDLFGKRLSYYTNIFCANMLNSNLEIEHSGYPMLQQDLFMENSSGLYSENAANKNRSPKRVKRRERKFLDGCLSHKTAVAVGALGGFLYSFTFV